MLQERGKVKHCTHELTDRIGLTAPFLSKPLANISSFLNASQCV